MKKSLNNLSSSEVITLLKKSGSKNISAETLGKAVDEGLPRNEDGSFDLIKITAFLIG